MTSNVESCKPTTVPLRNEVANCKQPHWAPIALYTIGLLGVTFALSATFTPAEFFLKEGGGERFEAVIRAQAYALGGGLSSFLAAKVAENYFSED